VFERLPDDAVLSAAAEPESVADAGAQFVPDAGAQFVPDAGGKLLTDVESEPDDPRRYG
jgi:hypothetical protein